MAGTSQGTTGNTGTENPNWNNENKNDIISSIPDEFETEVDNFSGLSIYDYAFKQKLLEVFPNVVSAHPDIVFKLSSENHDGKIKLPMITFYRMSNNIDESNFNHHESFYGRKVFNNVANKPCDYLTLEMAIPIIIEYQVDIWAQLRSYADGLFRELVFFLLRNPNIVIQIPEFNHQTKFALKFTGMDQPTDYSLFNDNYILHRYTLNYEIPTARLFYRGISEKLVKDIPITYVPLSQFTNL